MAKSNAERSKEWRDKVTRERSAGGDLVAVVESLIRMNEQLVERVVDLTERVSKMGDVVANALRTVVEHRVDTVSSIVANGGERPLVDAAHNRARASEISSVSSLDHKTFSQDPELTILRERSGSDRDEPFATNANVVSSNVRNERDTTANGDPADESGAHVSLSKGFGARAKPLPAAMHDEGHRSKAETDKARLAVQAAEWAKNGARK